MVAVYRQFQSNALPQGHRRQNCSTQRAQQGPCGHFEALSWCPRHPLLFLGTSLIPVSILVTEKLFLVWLAPHLGRSQHSSLGPRRRPTVRVPGPVIIQPWSSSLNPESKLSKYGTGLPKVASRGRKPCLHAHIHVHTLTHTHTHMFTHTHTLMHMEPSGAQAG